MHSLHLFAEDAHGFQPCTLMAENRDLVLCHWLFDQRMLGVYFRSQELASIPKNKQKMSLELWRLFVFSSIEKEMALCDLSCDINYTVKLKIWAVTHASKVILCLGLISKQASISLWASNHPVSNYVCLTEKQASNFQNVCGWYFSILITKNTKCFCLFSARFNVLLTMPQISDSVTNPRSLWSHLTVKFKLKLKMWQIESKYVLLYHFFFYFMKL